jgi:hypothetical protein
MIEKDWNQMFVEEMSQSINNGLETIPRNNTELAIQNECNRMAELLIKKNRAYGNSALDPVRIFSSSDNIEQLKVRIDDKLSRFVRGTEFLGDNDIDDLMGYLVLLSIANKETWK